VSTAPAMDRVAVTSSMTFVDRACADWEDGWKLPVVTRGENDSIRIDLQGEFPKNCAASTEINVLDRVDFADRLFRTLWRNLGGTFGGRTREAPSATADTRVLAQHRSRTLAEVTRDINKQSNNAITRMLYLSMGALSSDASTSVMSIRAEKEVRAWFKQHGIDDDGLVLENASGLSRIERIRASQLASVLKAAYRSKWAPEFMASLPIVGVDGGMEKRLRDTPVAGHARIKTGSLRDVAAVAGFVPCGQNETCIVVAMINHPLAKGAVAKPILDALIDSVVR
jgi:serine-type D-Ala-D-Ala carboxypeptidase/endopeptidase (penicillin-binding protein 4)